MDTSTTSYELGRNNEAFGKDTVSTKASSGEVANSIERAASKVPAVGYLNLALGSIVLSAGIAVLSRRKELANFVGLWAPSLMLMGIYNKIVKLEDSQRQLNPNLH